MGKILKFAHYNKDNVKKKTVDKVKQVAEEMLEEGKDEKQVKKLVSQFEDEMKKHRKRLSKNNTSLTEVQGNLAVLNALLKMTLNMVPTAERQFHKFKNERAIYPIVALTNQSRELMVEIRQLDNSDRLATHIMDNILTPTFKLVVGHLVSDFNTMKEEVNDILPPKEAKAMRRRLDEMLRSQGNLLDEIIRGSQTQLIEYLRGGK